MSKPSSKLMPASNDDIFSIINSWPYHLLDAVKAASIRSQANDIRFVVMRLMAEKKVDSYELSACVDNIRNILTWIDLYNSADVELYKIKSVQKELEKVLSYIEKLFTDVSMEEKTDMYQPYDDTNEES